MVFFTEQAKELGLPIKIYEFVKGKPIIVISWIGINPNLPSILLNGHMDVVPVVEVCFVSRLDTIESFNYLIHFYHHVKKV